ncbi:MAG: recombinase family protein [Cellvibrionales bacterium]|nr:recombinase family protein [Cellvibrionales bacterium]
MTIGYARVSSHGQSLQLQLNAIENHPCDRIFQEKKSGTKSENRAELQACLSFLRSGDTLAVTKLDRLP